MGHAIPVRTDYTAGEVRRFAVISNCEKEER
jgi:hypothetical protein